MSYRLYFDGGSRGNPGPSGAGASLVDASGNEIWHDAHFVGLHETNNVAEYTGLLRGLQYVASLPDVATLSVEVYGDSQLVIKQIKGEYKVSHPRLRTLWQQCVTLAQTPLQVEFVHIPRAQNKRADALANQAMDLVNAS
jgi:ribonuclease HI